MSRSRGPPHRGVQEENYIETGENADFQSPPIQGAIADHYSTRVSYYLVVPCFVYIAGWAFYIWNKDGRQTTVLRKKAHAAPVVDEEGQHNSPKAVAYGDEKATMEDIESVNSRQVNKI